MRMLNVAQYWRVDPESVARWAITDFDDREEYMMIQLDTPSDPNEPQPGEEIYTGPKGR
jgi:hypothetical protein